MSRPLHEIQLSLATGAEADTPEHKRFRTLMGKLDKARQRLQQWQEQLPLFSQKWQQRATPEIKRLRELRRAWAFELEQLLLGRRWTQSESQTLTQELLDLCNTLLAGEEEPDAELKALYNRHADLDFDSESKLELQSMKQMLETVGELDLGDAPVESAEDLMDRAREQMAQRDAEQRQAWEQAAAQFRKPARKKQSAAAKRAEEDARQASQTVREVYRKLAAALHPDRVATTANDEERARSTQLMQRANAAYEAGDLLALLTLQLQIEQVDQVQASRLAASQVRHFNKVLAEQLKELESEIDGRQHAFEMSYGFSLHNRLEPDQLGKVLSEVMQDLHGKATVLVNQKRLLSGDPVMAKRYLKRLQAEQRQQDAFANRW